MTPTFAPAVRHTVKARVALTGPSGSGKTYTALAIASGLAGKGKIALIDTEHSSASLYANEFDFDTAILDAPYSPQRYIEFIRAAKDYPVLVIDSLSHAWAMEGGVLSIVDRVTAQSSSKNSYMAWSQGTKEQNALIEMLLSAPMHVIVTMRTKTEYALDTVNGRTQPRKVGLAPVQRDGVDYEFALVGELSLEHRMTITKSRFKEFQDQVIDRPGIDFGLALLAEMMAGKPDSSATEAEDQPAATASGAVGGHRGEAPAEVAVDEGPADKAYGEGANSNGPSSTVQLERLIKVYGSKSRALFAAHAMFDVTALEDLDREQLTALIVAKADA